MLIRNLTNFLPKRWLHRSAGGISPGSRVVESKRRIAAGLRRTGTKAHPACRVARGPGHWRWRAVEPAWSLSSACRRDGSLGPNVPIATKRLQPLGVTVTQTHLGVHDTRGPQPDGSFPERRLPFPDAHFELVLAHSSAFCPTEVFRVLRPGGILLTAQGAPPLSPTLADVLQGPVPEWAKAGQAWDICYLE